MPSFHVSTARSPFPARLVHAGQVVVHERAVGIAGELGQQQRLVAGALVGPVAVVGGAADGEVAEGFDPEAVGVGRAVDGGDDGLEDVALEADVGPVAPEPVVEERRPPHAGDEPHAEAHAVVGSRERGAGVVEVAVAPPRRRRRRGPNRRSRGRGSGYAGRRSRPARVRARRWRRAARPPRPSGRRNRCRRRRSRRPGRGATSGRRRDDRRHP